jgi:thiamine-monophosphate kinase
MSGPPDEFEWIARLRPLTLGDPRALALADDAAVLPGRPGFDLVISKDAMVEGVHFLVGEGPAIVARRLLRTALSDLAAKAAEPFGYLLLTAWPAGRDGAWREAFARGLAADGEMFAIALLGGDTVSTPGPATFAATVLGWAPAGGAVLRSGAKIGDALVICGAIGDGWLGLRAAKGEIADPDGRLAERYRLPTPLLSLRDALRDYVNAAADVSDGLLADGLHIAEASRLGLAIDLGRLPLSPTVAAWVEGQADRGAARLALATGGDDYALACAVSAANEPAFVEAVGTLGVPVASVGRFPAELGLDVRLDGAPISTGRLGWRH